MFLNDLLRAKSLVPSETLVLRHVPQEPNLRKVFRWLAAEKPDVFNAYQQTQGAKLEKAMLRAKYVATFIGHASGKAIFVGIYKIGQSRPMTFDEYWARPEYIEMRDKFGMTGFSGTKRTSLLWFDLELTDNCSEWKGKLIIRWPPPDISWWRRAERNDIPIHSILEDNTLDGAMPQWDQLVLPWDALGILPQRWRDVISQWRGIYYIHDKSDGKGYVGGAYGTENILGRWLHYAASGHGGNTQLKKRSPQNFQFSILELVPINADVDEVMRKETNWKERLHTRTSGLNDN
jgi:hypothetical protein